MLIATLGVFTSYAPLLSVAPMWVTHGGAASGAAGAATGITMAATVAAQLCVPRLHRRLGFRAILAAGALVLGVPAFGYVLSASVGWVLAVSAVRGLGFGLVTVAGSALVAELVPAAGQGRAVGWYGMAVGLPQVLFLPLGVWAARHAGFAVVFAAAGGAGVVAAPLTMTIRPGLAAPRPIPGSSPGADRGGPRRPVFPADAV
ncbi:MAG TPA: MFS transporter, partial [Trebonia sp.]|nr:MFS transporter [Trebonia sp.]